MSRLLTIRPGKTIYVYGHVPRDSCNFDINLYKSPAGDNSDVALHIGVQFDAQAVILNSRENGCWRRVITADTFPFESGNKFLLTITTTTRTYDIKVNGTLLHSFVHRLPLQCVKRFGINHALCIGNLTAAVDVSYSVLVFCPSICLSVRPSVCPSVCLSVCLSVYMSVCMSVCLSVCLSVCSIHIFHTLKLVHSH